LFMETWELIILENGKKLKEEFMFKIALIYLKHLLSLVELAEDFGKSSGPEKKARVLGEFCQMLSDLPEKEKKKIPAFFLNPENLSSLIDLAVAMGNFISCRKSSYLISLAKALLAGGEEK